LQPRTPQDDRKTGAVKTQVGYDACDPKNVIVLQPRTPQDDRKTGAAKPQVGYDA